MASLDYASEPAAEAGRRAAEEDDPMDPPDGSPGMPQADWARYRLAMSRKAWMSAFCVPEK